MLTKTFRASVKVAEPRDGTGVVEAIVSVFSNRDAGREVVSPGAFTETLKQRTPKFVFHHDWKWPLGKTTAAREAFPGDEILPADLKALGGLYCVGQVLMADPEAARIHAHLAFGSLDEFSIGYEVKAARRVTQEGESRPADDFDLFVGVDANSTLYLDKLDLFEWSPVLVGMNDKTRVVSVKSGADGAAGLDLSAYFDSVTSQLRALHRAAKALAERRAKEGRTLSSANVSKLEGIAASLEEDASALRELLTTAQPKGEPAAGAKAGRTGEDARELARIRNKNLRLSLALARGGLQSLGLQGARA